MLLNLFNISKTRNYKNVITFEQRNAARPYHIEALSCSLARDAEWEQGSERAREREGTKIERQCIEMLVNFLVYHERYCLHDIFVVW